MEDRIKRHAELVELLFEKTYGCTATPMVLDAAAPVPINSEAIRSVVSPLDHVVYTVDSTGERKVLEAMFGHTRYTENEPQNRIIGNKPIDVTITIAHMAEIVFIGGSYTLNDPRDATAIVETIEEYLTTVADRRRYEPHYAPPPKEDMDKLSGLIHAIIPLSSRVHDAKQGTGFWAELDSLFMTTGKYNIGKDDQSFFDENKVDPSSSTRADPRMSRRDPYKF